MIPWIQIYSNLPQHRKTSRLAEELKISGAVVDPNTIAVGLLVGLWTWAIQNAYDGNLSECSPRTIANACQWKKKPETLVHALIKTGWLDEDMQLHDWEEYAVLLIDQEEKRKQKTRERVNRYRHKKSEKCNVTDDVSCNVTDTQCNASTIHNHTKPNITPDSTTNVVKSGTKRVAEPPPKEQTGFSPQLQAAFESWLRYKKQRWEGYQDEGLKALIGRIRNCSAQYGEDAVAQVITDSMSSGYKGILFDRLPNCKRQMVQTAQTGRDIAAEVEDTEDWMDAYLAGGGG